MPFEVEPSPSRPAARFCAPDEAQEASYLAASARMRSLPASFSSMAYERLSSCFVLLACDGSSALGQEVAGRSASRLARDTVVARAGELDQIEAVAERVGHVGDAAVLADGDVAVERAAQGDEPRHRGVEIGDDEVEMDRRPMALEAARHLPRAEIGVRRAL